MNTHRYPSGGKEGIIQHKSEACFYKGLSRSRSFLPAQPPICFLLPIGGSIRLLHSLTNRLYASCFLQAVPFNNSSRQLTAYMLSTPYRRFSHPLLLFSSRAAPLRPLRLFNRHCTAARGRTVPGRAYPLRRYSPAALSMATHGQCVFARALERADVKRRDRAAG